MVLTDHVKHKYSTSEGFQTILYEFYVRWGKW